MKIDKTTRNQMKEDIKVVLSQVLKSGRPSDLTTGQMHQVWFHTFANRSYPDSNLNVRKVDGQRILPQIDDYELYPCGTNDTTLATALKSIFKELDETLQ